MTEPIRFNHTQQRVMRLIHSLQSMPWPHDNDKLRSLCSWAQDIQIYDGYASGPDAPNGIISGNWNNIDRYDHRTHARVIVSDWPKRIAAILKRCGVSIEWQTDCMGWRPEYMVGDGEVLCEFCIAKDPDEWLELVAKGDSRHLWQLDSIDPSEHGYALYSDSKVFYSTERLIKEMAAEGHNEFVFTQDRAYACSVYIKVSSEEDE